MTDPVVFLNGAYIASHQAKVSVLDRGFMFGDAVYEVIPVYKGHVFRLKEHIDRLHNNLNALFTKPPYTLSEWQAIIKKLTNQDPTADQSVYIQITRGEAERDLAIGMATQATVFAMSKRVSRHHPSAGIDAITVEDIRWQYCHIKSTNLLANVLLKHQAYQAGAVEALLIRSGYLTEGTASNVFIVKNGIVKTPPKSNHLLPGITRDLLIELLHESNIRCREAAVGEAELGEADEIWITSSIKEIVPVTRLNGDSVGTGKAGDIWREANQLYQTFKAQMTCPSTCPS